MKQSAKDPKDIARAKNALLYFGKHPTEKARDIAEKLLPPYRSSFHTILLREMNPPWLVIDPESPTRFRYIGPNPATDEDAVYYLENCTAYSRRQAAERASKQTALLHKAAEAMKPKEEAAGIQDNELWPWDHSLPNGKDQAPGEPQRFKVAGISKPEGQVSLFAGEFADETERRQYKELALMQKALKYGIKDPVAFVADCMNDPRI